MVVQHAVNRVEDAYGAFRFAARQVGVRVAAVGGDVLMDHGVSKRLMKDVCGEDVDGCRTPDFHLYHRCQRAIASVASTKPML